MSATLSLDTKLGALAIRLDGTELDLARIAGELRFLLAACDFADADDLLLGIGRYLVLPPSEDVPRVVSQAHLALMGGVIAERTFRPENEAFLIEDKPFGHVDVVRDGARAGIYRLRVGAGLGIPLHVHRRMEEWELILSDGLLLQRIPAAAGTARRWPHDLPHRYDNPTGIEHSVLCVDRPRFAPDDEIEVPEPAEGLRLVPEEAYFQGVQR